MTYSRVLPRDLFNESKLLKCLGQLSLLIHEGRLGGRLLEVVYESEEEDGFRVDLDADNNCIFCSNVRLVLEGRVEVTLLSPHNSRLSYPLQFGELEGWVFDDEGNPTEEFLAHLDKLAAP